MVRLSKLEAVVRFTYLYGMKGNTGDWCNALTHEAFVILDGAQSVSRVIQHSHKLLN